MARRRGFWMPFTGELAWYRTEIPGAASVGFFAAWGPGTRGRIPFPGKPFPGIIGRGD